MLNPSLSNAHSLIGYSLMQLGDGSGAEAEFQAEPHATFRLAGLAIIRRRRGDVAGATLAYDQLVRQIGDSALYQQAEILAQWGDKPAALETLERAHSVGDAGLVYIGTDPLLDPIRTAPGFVRLMRMLGFG